jgi:rhamnogalacturonyl hydrolase YesR
MKVCTIFCTVLVLATANTATAAQADDYTLIHRVADGILRQTTRRLIDRSNGATYPDSSALAPKPEISIESKFNAWLYQTWLLTDGMRRAAGALDEAAYRNYGEQNLEFIYHHLAYFERQYAARMKAAPVGDGTLSPIEFYFKLGDLWHTGLAPLVMERFAETSDKQYEPYLVRLREFLAKCPRLPDGTLYRPRGRLMADDPYMVVPYLVRQHRATGDGRHLDAAAQQVLGSKNVLFDSGRGLYRHAWDVKRQQPLGQFWGRANGWMVLAQVELLAGLPAVHPRHAEARAAFTAHATGLRNAQDRAGGWHQLLDHPESWLETSCTGMFVYGLARGVNEGWLDASFAEPARKGWAALRNKITPEADIVDVCGSTDIGDVDYYLKRPRLQGDLHGFGPFLLAGSEILRLPQARARR